MYPDATRATAVSSSHKEHPQNAAKFHNHNVISAELPVLVGDWLPTRRVTTNLPAWTIGHTQRYNPTARAVSVTGTRALLAHAAGPGLFSFRILSQPNVLFHRTLFTLGENSVGLHFSV